MVRRIRIKNQNNIPSTLSVLDVSIFSFSFSLTNLIVDLTFFCGGINAIRIKLKVIAEPINGNQ